MTHEDMQDMQDIMKQGNFLECFKLRASSLRVTYFSYKNVTRNEDALTRNDDAPNILSSRWKTKICHKKVLTI